MQPTFISIPNRDRSHRSCPLLRERRIVLIRLYVVIACPHYSFPSTASAGCGDFFCYEVEIYPYIVLCLLQLHRLKQVIGSIYVVEQLKRIFNLNNQGCAFRHERGFSSTAAVQEETLHAVSRVELASSTFPF